MTLVIADRVREYSSTTGTGTYTLSGAQVGFQSFAAVGNGNTCEYCCTDGVDWEVGLGTYSTTGPTLARTSIYASSNANAAVSWTALLLDIFLTLPADGWIRTLPVDTTTGNAAVIGTLSAVGHVTFEGVTSTGATGAGKLVFDTSPTIAGHPTVEGVTATGATGTGNFVFDTSPTIAGHPTVEGVTATGATGTGKFVFDSTPTLTGTLTAAIANFSGLATFNAGATVASGQTLTLTGATVAGTPTWSSSQAITLSTAAQPNVTSVGTLTGLTLSGALVGAASQDVFNTVSTTVNAFRAASVALNIGHASAAAAFAGGVTVASGKTLTLTGATVAGAPTWSSSQAITLSTAAQPNVTSLGTLTGLSVSGTVITTSLLATTSGGVFSAEIRNSHASDPYGLNINYTGAAPNDASHSFLRLTDTGATRFEVFSNGSLTAGAISGTTLTSTISGVTNPVSIGRNAATIYGAISFNNQLAGGSASNIGFTGGGGTDLHLYYLVPAGGAHSLRIDDVEKMLLSTTGLAVTGTLGVSSLAGTGTRHVVVDANGVMSAP